jgi:hypothetical protein
MAPSATNDLNSYDNFAEYKFIPKSGLKLKNNGINQCLKYRTPVKTIAMCNRFAASMTSLSRIDPPG